MKDIKDLKKWKDILYLWIRRLNVIKMAVLPKFISSVHIKIPTGTFAEIHKLVVKFNGNAREPEYIFEKEQS